MRYIIHGCDHTHSTLVSFDQVCTDLVSNGYGRVVQLYRSQCDLSDWGVDVSERGIRRFAKERLIDVRRGNLGELAVGFNSARITPCLALFSSDRLKAVMCGNYDFTIDDLVETIDFKPAFGDDLRPQNSQWAFRGMLQQLRRSSSTLRQLLQYITGLCAIPQSENFRIEVIWSKNKQLWPTARTCFNQLTIAHGTPIEKIIGSNFS
jgi:hypothetical protein